MTRSAASAYVQNLVTTLLSSTTTTPPPTPMTSPRIIVVGQSVWTDIVALRYDRSFRLHLPNMLKRKTSTSSSSDIDPSSVTTTNNNTPNSPFYIFDTHKLALSASDSGGQFIGGLRLASIALNLGIEAQYRTPRTDTRQALQDFVHYGSDPLVGMDLKGCHNASNDAAYALMTMLLLGLRWREFVGSDGVRAGKVWEQTGGLVADVGGGGGSGDTDAEGGTFEENEKSSKEKKLLSWREWLGQTLRGCFRVEK